jgi:hypothetical protein
VTPAETQDDKTQDARQELATAWAGSGVSGERNRKRHSMSADANDQREALSLLLSCSGVSLTRPSLKKRVLLAGDLIKRGRVSDTHEWWVRGHFGMQSRTLVRSGGRVS